MKKKSARKLQLSRETLTRLDLLRVRGAECSVDCEDIGTCGTDDGGCGVPPTTCFATCSCGGT